MSTQLPNTIAGLLACLRSGELSIAEAITCQRNRFNELDAGLHATTYADGNDQSNVSCIEDFGSRPLAAVGLAHKDIFTLNGRQAGLGRGEAAQCVNDSTETLVQAPVLTRLADAGALNLGALTMAEDACAATAQTRHQPIPVNPLGRDIAVGGSSSGSAVAVASGMVYASLGTDTAGSVRIPAMTCGVMGLKTTHGLMDQQGMAPLCPSLDSIGVLARSVADLGDVVQVLAPELAACAQVPKAAFWFDESVLDEAIAPLVSQAMQRYADRQVDVADLEARAASWQEVIMTYEVGQTHRARIADGSACAQVQGLGRTGLAMPETWWQLALADRKPCLQAFIDKAFAHADVLLAPLQVDALPKADEVYVGHPAFTPAKLLGLHHYCGWVNYLGLPALSLPVGFDKQGLPVSLQLIGRPFAERQLLALGQQIQTDIYGEQGIMPVLRI